VATFVKAFGVGFLARPRSEQAANARESSPTMLAGMGVAGVACVVLALTPAVALPAVGRASGRVFGAADPVSASLLTVRLQGFAGSLAPLLVAAAVVVATMAVAVLARLFAARHQARVSARLWDCGAGPLSARMEYTATSFAEPLQRVFDDVVRPEHDVDITHYRESRYLVDEVSYRLRVPDRVEHRLYRPVLAGVRAWGPGRAAVGQRQRAPLPRLRLRCRVWRADPAGGDPVSELASEPMSQRLRAAPTERSEGVRERRRCDQRTPADRPGRGGVTVAGGG
jgi:hypothetical protein